MKEKMEQYFKEFKTEEQVQKKIGEILSNKKYALDKGTIEPIKLKRIEIENLVDIKKAVLDFENNKIILIEGINGIGKTLIAETITLMLNNIGRDTMNNIISRETRIRLDFEINIEKCLYMHSIILEKKKWSQLVNGVVDMTGQTEIMKCYRGIGIDDIFKEIVSISDRKSYITEKLPAEFKTFFMKFFDIIFADKIRKDIDDSIDHNRSRINGLHGEKTGLVDQDGPNAIQIKINTLEKELKKTESIEKEYVDIVTNGSGCIVKLQNEIQKLRNKKTEKMVLQKKVNLVMDNENVFQKLAKKEKELIVADKEMEKKLSKKEKLAAEAESLSILKENIEDSIKVLEKQESNCEICGSELSIVRKQLILKTKKEKVDSTEESIKLVEKKIGEFSIDSLPVEQLEKEIDDLNIIINELYSINVKNQGHITKILEKYNIDNIVKEIENITKVISEKEAQKDKLTEHSPVKRKAELESQIKQRRELQSELAIWQEKEKTYNSKKERIEKLNEEIKIIESQDKLLESIVDIFDKNRQSSFPIWYLNSSIKQIESEVNQELVKFKKLKMKLKIDNNFKITINGLMAKTLSEAELKMVNFLIKIIVAKQRFNIIPFFIFDSWENGSDKNTLNILKEIINHYIENGYLNNIILTQPTLSEELVIKGSAKI